MSSVSLAYLYYTFQKAITKALVRLCGSAGWSVPLLFTCSKVKFSHETPVFQIAGEEKQALKIRGEGIVDRIPEWKASVIEKTETNLAAGDGSRGKLICTRFECVSTAAILRPFL